MDTEVPRNRRGNGAEFQRKNRGVVLDELDKLMNNHSSEIGKLYKWLDDNQDKVIEELDKLLDENHSKAVEELKILFNDENQAKVAEELERLLREMAIKFKNYDIF